MKLAISTAPKQNSLHWVQSQVLWEDILAWATVPADVKACGNYLLGVLRPTTTIHDADQICTALHRRKEAVVSRCAITLDVDYPSPAFLDTIQLLFPYQALIHTTYSSTPDQPRYRLIVPTDRLLAPDEYVITAREMMRQLGAEQFDPGSDQPERYMFKPAAQNPDWYAYWPLTGPLLPVEPLLAAFEADLSHKPLPKLRGRKRDPFGIEGVVGAFNRAYENLELLVEAYDLPYEAVSEDRWQLIGARSAAGMGEVAPGLYFSHHVHDPAGGQACTAFDLVRLHRFGELDADESAPVQDRPSHAAMLTLAGNDPRVVAQVAGIPFTTVVPDDWRLQLERSPKTGKMTDSVRNWDMVVEHESLFAGLRFNEMGLTIETAEDLPWRPLSRGAAFTDVDRFELSLYLEREYGVRINRAFLDGLVDTAAARSSYSPVRQYLESLSWDGTPRVEECLPGVIPTDYTRFVAKKSLVAAVARQFEPGCKWDHTLVLFGGEGIGKSYWIDKMARGYSGTMGALGDKDTLITMQRVWIMVSDEGHVLQKAASDAQKEFLTRTTDVFRMPYERTSQVRPRHCVMWATTNDPVFLRRQEGNRRFLTVYCSKKLDFSRLTDDYIDQVWAEAVALYRAGEPLYLDEMQTITAREEREIYVEEDALSGVIEAFLEEPVPADWYDMSPEARRLWVVNRGEGLVPPGTQLQHMTCSAQIWVEVMGRRFGEHRRADLLEITNTLKRLPGWRALAHQKRIPGYGKQVVFERTQDERNHA